MLRISTVPEALAELQKQTGQPWSESDLFDFASKYNIELQAATPLSAVPVIYRFVIGEGLVQRMKMPAGHSPLAVLFPWQVAHLWIRGETETRHPIDHEQPGDDYKWYDEPVRVRREDVRVHERSLWRILKVHAERVNAGIAPVQAVSQAQPEQEAWQKLAPEYAAQVVAGWRLSRRPTKAEIAEKIAHRFRAEGISGKRGELDSAYILRHGLGNWKAPNRVKNTGTAG